MKRIILKPGEERRILAGHPWVYDNEVAAILADLRQPDLKRMRFKSGAAELESGECADVESSPVKGKPVYLGRAIVNPNSRIIARIYSPSKEGLDKGFFKRRIREALERRIAAGCDLSRESARLVFAEADGLPGLIIDRYVGRPVEAADLKPSSWLVIQFLTYGMDCRRDMILEALEEVLNGLSAPAGIIEKSAPVRELEGLPLRDGIISGHVPPGGAAITENGLVFLTGLLGGQKTGHYLDQRDNRRLAAAWAAVLAGERCRAGADKQEVSGKGVRILDCFCYTGGFALHIGRALQDSGIRPGAAELIAVDASAEALDIARKNAAINGISIQTREANGFDFLRDADRRKERYDMIVLDPPAFAKSHSSLEGAERGYREINLRALKILEKGGILVTCSCSHAMDEGRFKRIIAEAASDAGRRIIQLDFRYQAADHPILVGYDESLYLKCGFYRVL
jgi:23S rRNA (cytosine1962-C5)-methyltransferase